jgi:hypothetical protein
VGLNQVPVGVWTEHLVHAFLAPPVSLPPCFVTWIVVYVFFIRLFFWGCWFFGPVYAREAGFGPCVVATAYGHCTKLSVWG